jgi:hypothetical protein
MNAVERMKKDYDWIEAFGVCGVSVDNVTHVYYEDPGENDGDEWIAIVGWLDCDIPENFEDTPEDRLVAADLVEESGDLHHANQLRNIYAVISAWCDYTGWG